MKILDVAELAKGNKKHAASFKPVLYSFVYPGPKFIEL
jgi:hypothetical protein